LQEEKEEKGTLPFKAYDKPVVTPGLTRGP